LDWFMKIAESLAACVCCVLFPYTVLPEMTALAVRNDSMPGPPLP